MSYSKIFLPLLVVLPLLTSCFNGSDGGSSTHVHSLDLQFTLSNNSIVAKGIEKTKGTDTYVRCDIDPGFVFMKKIGLKKPPRIAYGASMSTYCDECIFNITCKPGEAVDLSITPGNWAGYPTPVRPSAEVFDPSNTGTASFTCPASGVYADTVYALINRGGYGTYKIIVSDDEVTDVEYLECSVL